MTHVLPTNNTIHIARRSVPENASNKIKLAFAETGSRIVRCGIALVSIFAVVGRACQMAHVDPYRPPKHRND